MSEVRREDVSEMAEGFKVTDTDSFSLTDWSTDATCGVEKSNGKPVFKSLRKELRELQLKLFAEDEHSILVCLNGLDASGKNSTIKKVFKKVHAHTLDTTSFKPPTEKELRYDFLWRIHQNVPEQGMVGIFNRSHYEDVTTVRVKNLVEKQTWKNRFRHINEFERMLVDEGTRVLKFFLHISKEYQKERFERRLRRNDKHWKFHIDDVRDRRRWDEFTEVWEDAIVRTNTDHAPWYVIPSENRWYRNLVMCKIMNETIKDIGPEYPPLDVDPEDIDL